MAVEVQASKELRDMARQMRQLAKDMQQGDAEAVVGEMEAVKAAVRRSAMATVPARGGLARLVANSALTVVRRGSGVTLRAANRLNIDRMNSGTVRHPIYGRRAGRWVNQRIPSKWFDNPTLASEVRLRRAVERNRQRILNQVR